MRKAAERPAANGARRGPYIKKVFGPTEQAVPRIGTAARNGQAIIDVGRCDRLRRPSAARSPQRERERSERSLDASEASANEAERCEVSIEETGRKAGINIKCNLFLVVCIGLNLPFCR